MASYSSFYPPDMHLGGQDTVFVNGYYSDNRCGSSNFYRQPYPSTEGREAVLPPFHSSSSAFLYHPSHPESTYHKVSTISPLLPLEQQRSELTCLDSRLVCLPVDQQAGQIPAPNFCNTSFSPHIQQAPQAIGRYSSEKFTAS